MIYLNIILKIEKINNLKQKKTIKTRVIEFE
jgi:hypothetical protein